MTLLTVPRSLSILSPKERGPVLAVMHKCEAGELSVGEAYERIVAAAAAALQKKTEGAR